MKNRIFMQILPLFIVSIILTALLGYSRLVEDKGALLFKIYNSELNNLFKDKENIYKINDIYSSFKKIPIENKYDTSFIYIDNKNIITSDNKALSSFFVEYMNELSEFHNNHVYDFVGDLQGVYINLNTDKGIVKVGIKYMVASTETVFFFIISFIVLLVIFIALILYVSHSLSEDIHAVIVGLNDIMSDNLNKPVEVISNDEIGELSVLFNKFRDIQKSLKESEKLMLLGNLTGDVTHNINNHLVSVRGLMSKLNEIFEELNENPDLENKDYVKIDTEEFSALKYKLKKSQNDLDIVKGYIRGINNTITQIYSSERESDFTIKELLVKVTNSVKTGYILDISSVTESVLNFRITGILDVLFHTIMNIINNAIQEYIVQNKGNKVIILHILCTEKDIFIKIRDFGRGIKKEVEEKLYKGITSTKKEGDNWGMGLCLSQISIGAFFKGEITHCKANDTDGGTIFIINIPNSKIKYT